MKRLSLCLLTALFVATPLSASQESALQAGTQLWNAYAGGEMQNSSDLWADPFQRDRLTRETQRRCQRVLDSTLEVSEENDVTALVTVDAHIARWSPSDSQTTWIDEEHYAIELQRKERWQCVGWYKREDRLADSLANAAPEERGDILRRHSDLMTPDLAIALGRASLRLVNQNRNADAASLITLARAIAEDAADDRAIASVLGSASVLLRQDPHGDPQESIRIAEDAERHAIRSGDIDTLALVRVYLARALESSDPSRAEALALSVVAMEEVLVDSTPGAKAASQLARMYDDALDHGKALRFSLIAARNAELSGDASARLSAALNLGGAYSYAGLHDFAIKHYERALSIAQDAGFVEQAIGASAALIWSYWGSDGGSNRVDAMYDQALDLAICAGPQVDAKRVELLLYRAIRARENGEPLLASGTLAAAYELMTHGPVDVRIAANVVLMEAWLLIDANQPRAALDAVAEAREIVGTRPEWQYDQHLARPTAYALVLLGRREEAVKELERAVAVGEEERINFALEPLTRQSFLEQGADTYRDLIRLSLEAGNTERALEVADRLSARTLRDFNTSAGRVAPRKTEAIAAAERKIVNLNRQLLSSAITASQREDRTRDLKRARSDLDELSAQYAPTTTPAAVAGSQLPTLGSLPQGTIVVKFVVMEQQTVAFVLNAQSITSTIIPVTRRKLERVIDELRAKIEKRDYSYTLQAASAYRLLVRPLFRRFGKADRLILIPDGPLWLLPFQALRDGHGRYFSDRVEISYAPSLSWAFDQRPERHRPNSILAVGDPELGATTRATVRSMLPGRELGRLQDAALEANEIAGLYGRSTVLTGKAALESAVKQSADGYDVLHFAAHAFLEQKQPMYSSIVLAARSDEDEDGLLEVREISSLDLHSNLVVLSACSTARGRIISGEGVVGLTWAFLSRGVRRVISSQWQASSRSTATLMIQLHRHLTAGDDPATALRKAQRELRRNPRYRHPFYWAPFIVVGTP